MADTAVRGARRTPRSARATDAAAREADRTNAAAALQRALDRRDNGGVTGH
ncbi:hypothetical protein ACFP1Z_13670 [Streptomyces gamaensis]|uniref:Uncharacterized protein n=1 Tax=Streptomyces gamaensis TaxID=1763542 RepID=A0ABW0YX88_9ACTN